MRRSEVRDHVWEFETENGAGGAYLHEDGICLYLNVGEEDVIRLAIDFRSLTPTDADLVFCRMGYDPGGR
jgi:hypothetical protein